MSEKNNATATAKASETKKATSAEGTEAIEKKPKLNADSFAAWKGNATNRSKDEEKHETPAAEHAERGKRESDGYYNARQFTFDFTGLIGKKAGEHRTPQANLDLIVATANAKLPKERRIVRSVYVARTFELRFFQADAPKNEYVAVKVNRKADAQKFAAKLGLA